MTAIKYVYVLVRNKKKDKMSEYEGQKKTIE